MSTPEKGRPCPLWVKSGHRTVPLNVRFTPKSGHRAIHSKQAELIWQAPRRGEPWIGLRDSLVLIGLFSH